MSHKASRARSRLDDRMFGTFNVRTAAVNGVNGIGHIDTLLRPCAAKGCGVFLLHDPKRQSQKAPTARDKHAWTLTKNADRRLVRCANVRRPSSEAPESDHNLVCAKIRIPRRSGLNRRKRDSTKKIPSTADIRRLMADPNLRCQVTVLPLIPDGTCISDVATDMADVMLSTAAELAPRSKRPRGAQG